MIFTGLEGYFSWAVAAAPLNASAAAAAIKLRRFISKTSL
jgi:hypothetical protein